MNCETHLNKARAAAKRATEYADEGDMARAMAEARAAYGHYGRAAYRAPTPEDRDLFRANARAMAERADDYREALGYRGAAGISADGLIAAAIAAADPAPKADPAPSDKDADEREADEHTAAVGAAVVALAVAPTQAGTPRPLILGTKEDGAALELLADAIEAVPDRLLLAVLAGLAPQVLHMYRAAKLPQLACALSHAQDEILTHYRETITP